MGFRSPAELTAKVDPNRILYLVGSLQREWNSNVHLSYETDQGIFPAIHLGVWKKLEEWSEYSITFHKTHLVLLTHVQIRNLFVWLTRVLLQLPASKLFHWELQQIRWRVTNWRSQSRHLVSDAPTFHSPYARRHIEAFPKLTGAVCYWTLSIHFRNFTERA